MTWSLRQTLVALALTSMVSVPANSQSVSFAEKKGMDVDIFIVKSASGDSEEAAVRASRILALQKAGEGLGGTSDEKRQITTYLGKGAQTALATATLQRVTRRMWGDSGPIIDARIYVNTTDLGRVLTEAGMMATTKELAKSVGNPTIMILYSGLTDRQRSHEETQLGEVVTTYITGFLTKKRWNIVDRKQIQRARKQMKAQGAVEGLPPDPQAQLAMLVGADIYMEFSIVPSTARGLKADVSIKAFDTTTAKVRAAGTASSRVYPAGTTWAKIMQEALGNTMPSIFENLRGYWLEDASEGRPIFIVIDADFSERSRYNGVRNALKDMGTWEKREKTPRRLTGVLRYSGDVDDMADDLDEAMKESGFSKVTFPIESRSMIRVHAVTDGF